MLNNEFGSDYHQLDDFPRVVDTPSKVKWNSRNLYADGRQAINALIDFRGWKRIWIPTYFCQEVVESIRKTGIEVVYYDDYPLADDNKAIGRIEIMPEDVILRMNYFGLRGWRDNRNLGVDVIEDHSHDLTGEWVANSNADWCIASLRKSLPIAEGGALWSPKGLQLPQTPVQTEQNERLAEIRWQAMEMKRLYLEGECIDKSHFRSLYIETENLFEELPLSAISERDYRIVSSIDTGEWNALKKRNWRLLNRALSEKIEVLEPENDRCVPFSFVIRGQGLRGRLIEKKVYPAILWEVSEEVNQDLLSLHCDGRYTESDIQSMISIIEECLKS